jgi:hypothetical protein
LFASETEKDDVNEDRGGIVKVDPTIPWRGGLETFVIVIAIALN